MHVEYSHANAGWGGDFEGGVGMVGADSALTESAATVSLFLLPLVIWYALYLDFGAK
jgi:hypothetical protein